MKVFQCDKKKINEICGIDKTEKVMSIEHICVREGENVKKIERLFMMMMMKREEKNKIK